MCDSELFGQPLTQSRLFGKAVTNALLMTKEQGLLLVADHEELQGGYKSAAHKGEIEVKSADVSYLTNWGNDIAQRA
jgi:hypothetical protein